MASDTEATEGNHSRFDVEKIWPCGGLVMGYTGTDSVRQPLRDAVAAVCASSIPVGTARRDARDALQAAALPVLRRVYGLYAGQEFAAGGVPAPLAGGLLIAGRDSEGYWLLEMDHLNQATFFDEHGFHAVGSGSLAAYVAKSLMADYDVGGRTTAELTLIAHRTVQNCIDALGGAHGVGGEVRLWSSEQGAPFAQLSMGELDAIADGVAQWRAIERESLRKVFVDSASEPDDAGAPLPEPLEATPPADPAANP